MNRAGLLDLFPEVRESAEFWSTREWKIWAVDMIAGPTKRPTYNTTRYVRARTAEAAVACVKRNLVVRPPRGTRFTARLATWRELGCVRTAA